MHTQLFMHTTDEMNNDCPVGFGSTNMKWFKFYGQDYLTDNKIKALSVEMRQCWVILLCMASGEEKGGKLKFVQENEVKRMAGIEEDGQTWHETTGFLLLFKDMEMITIDNEINGTYNITLLNFQKRQGEAMTPYERVKKYRESKKHNDNAPTLSNSFKPLQNVIKNEANDNDDNKTDNGRLEEIRGDKNTIVLSDKQKVPAKKIITYERKPEEKQTPLHKVAYYLEDTLQTKTVNWGKAAKAYDMMLRAGYTEKQIMWVINQMSLDEFYQDKGFDLMTVANNIDKYKAKARKVINVLQQTK
jgi:hypothetical protein